MYFYKCPDLLEPGDVIRNGNWGRKILGVGPSHNAFYREMLFEKIRAAEFASAPSRMQIAFAFPDGVFPAGWSRGMAEILYVVKPEDPGVEIRAFDMGWFDALHEEHATSFSEAEELIRRYWRGETSPKPKFELLVPCPLVVLERLHPIPTAKTRRQCPKCNLIYEVVTKLSPTCPSCRNVSFVGQ